MVQVSTFWEEQRDGGGSTLEEPEVHTPSHKDHTKPYTRAVYKAQPTQNRLFPTYSSYKAPNGIQDQIWSWGVHPDLHNTKNNGIHPKSWGLRATSLGNLGAALSFLTRLKENGKTPSTLDQNERP